MMNVAPLSKWQKIRLATLTSICLDSAQWPVYHFPDGSLQMSFVSKGFETLREAAAAVDWRLDVASTEDGGIDVAIVNALEATNTVQHIEMDMLRSVNQALATSQKVIIPHADVCEIIQSFITASAELWAQALGLQPKASAGGGVAFPGIPMGSSDGCDVMMLKQQIMMAEARRQMHEASPCDEQAASMLRALMETKCVVEPHSSYGGIDVIESTQPAPLLTIQCGDAAGVGGDAFHRLVIASAAAICHLFLGLCNAQPSAKKAAAQKLALPHLAATISAQRRIKDHGIRVKFPVTVLEQALLLQPSSVLGEFADITAFSELRQTVEFPHLQAKPACEAADAFTGNMSLTYHAAFVTELIAVVKRLQQ